MQMTDASNSKYQDEKGMANKDMQTNYVAILQRQIPSTTSPKAAAPVPFPLLNEPFPAPSSYI